MITRVSGIAATIGFVAVAVFGVVLAKRFGSQGGKGKLRLHRQLSELSILVLGVHIGAALLDRHHVPPYAVVAPFFSPVRTIAAGTGSLAVWGLLLVAITGAGRRRFKRSWRTIHYLAYPAIGLVLAHSLLGSDRRQLVSLGAVSVAALVIWAGFLRNASTPASLSVTASDGSSEILVPVGAGGDPAPESPSEHPQGLLDGDVADGHSGWLEPSVDVSSKIRQSSPRIDRMERWCVGVAVAMDFVSYGWLAVRVHRIARSKSKGR
jgi:DMSO/TMAO reductase YedYZ heme-binding membrane subunit